MPLSPDRDRRMMHSPDHGMGRPRGNSSMGYGRPPMGGGGSSGNYKVLCVSSLHPKASDDVIRDTLYREFKKYGEISVRVIQDPDERVAYVYFRNFDMAREARHSKSRIILFDKAAIVEPVYENRSTDYSYRRPRSISPPSYSNHPSRYRSRSPERERYHRDYRDDYHHGPPPRDYYPRDSRSHMSRGHHNNRRGGYNDYGYGSERQPRRENKKDKFPNYLDHKAPEDDPLATRTLFTGNLELNITEEEMKRIFGRYGRLVDIDIKRPPPGTGNAYAFIRYENLDQAHRAKVELSGQYIGKFQCKIGYGKVNATPKIWIGGLGTWTSVSLLEREFDRFGAIQKIDYRKGDPQAHIFYETLEAAQAAVQEMRGFPLGGPDKRIRIDYSDLEEFTNSKNNSREGNNQENFGNSGRNKYYSRDSFDRVQEWDGDRRGGADGRRSEPESGGDFSPRSDDNIHNLSNARSTNDIAQMVPVSWDGGLILKNSLFPTKLHFVEGSSTLSDLLKDEDGIRHIKITQRMRLEASKLDDMSRQKNAATNYALFLGVSTSGDSTQELNSDIQSRPLRNLISYLKQKEAAGVVSIKHNQQPGMSGVVYCFPPCPYSFDLLKKEAPNLNSDELKDDHLVILVL